MDKSLQALRGTAPDLQFKELKIFHMQHDDCAYESKKPEIGSLHCHGNSRLARAFGWRDEFAASAARLADIPIIPSQANFHEA
ncbi:hypothetical protein [Burkholderia gladioli]|uniref:hypothetical protein n=1 Tax=Burkholderia gladioli TaxID=28095 RepID=UPI000F5284DA|nr:hypothetical protein [Burkholderia gladioli]